MSGLNLHLREIATALPTHDDAAADVPDDAGVVETWHDSTLELERGLDVVELALEPPDPKADPPA